MPLEQTYPTYHSKFWLVCDKEKGICVPSLLSHVAQDDYFGTLATVLNFVREGVIEDFQDKAMTREHCVHILECMRDDLRNLQDRYCIAEK